MGRETAKALGWISLALGTGLAWVGLLGMVLACIGLVCDDGSAATWNALIGTLIACSSALALYRYAAWPH